MLEARLHRSPSSFAMRNFARDPPHGALPKARRRRARNRLRRRRAATFFQRPLKTRANITPWARTS